MDEPSWHVTITTSTGETLFDDPTEGATALAAVMMAFGMLITTRDADPDVVAAAPKSQEFTVSVRRL